MEVDIFYATARGFIVGSGICIFIALIVFAWLYFLRTRPGDKANVNPQDQIIQQIAALGQGLSRFQKEFEDYKVSVSKIDNVKVIDTLAYMEHLLEKFGTKLEDEELTRQRFELHMERKLLDHENKTQDKLDGLTHVHLYLKKPKSDEILEEPEKEAKNLYDRARKQNKLFETHGS